MIQSQLFIQSGILRNPERSDVCTMRLPNSRGNASTISSTLAQTCSVRCLEYFLTSGKGYLPYVQMLKICTSCSTYAHRTSRPCVSFIEVTSPRSWMYISERRIFGECSAPACANYTVLNNADEHFATNFMPPCPLKTTDTWMIRLSLMSLSHQAETWLKLWNVEDFTLLNGHLSHLKF